MIFVIFGPGGVGKGTLVSRLLPLDPRLRLSRSWTTRPRRPGEAAEAYVFVEPADFEGRVAADGFLEWTRFPANGHLYGTPRPDPEMSGDLLLEIDLAGAESVRAQEPAAVLLLVTAPSLEIQEQRLRARGDDDEAVRRRLELGRVELERGRVIADHVVVNDDVDRAAREAAGIIALRRAGG